MTLNYEFIIVDEIRTIIIKSYLQASTYEHWQSSLKHIRLWGDPSYNWKPQFPEA